MDSLANANEPIHVEITPEGKENPAMRLADGQEESDARWAKLPPIYWDARVYRAKPGADVLVVDPDKSKETSDGKIARHRTVPAGTGPGHVCRHRQYLALAQE